MKRAGVSVIVLILLITLVFFLIRIAPGNPTTKFISPNLSPALVEQVKESFQLDKPVIEQYGAFILNFIKGDMGISYTYRKSVISVVSESLQFTIIFSILSLTLQLFSALMFALIAAKNINGWFDKTMIKITFAVYSIPPFVIGLVLVLIFSLKLSIFPSSDLHSLDFHSRSFIGKFFDYLHHLVLPLITISAGGIALFFKYIRDNLVEVMDKPFVTYLRSHGVDEAIIRKKHILPNALSPLLSVAGVEFGLLLGGALITEVIFGLPGMGRLTVDAIFSRDYPLIVGCTLVSGTLVIIANFIADFVKALIDKRSAIEMIQ